MRPISIFPNVDFYIEPERGPYSAQVIETLVRIKDDDGKWYTTLVSEKYLIDSTVTKIDTPTFSFFLSRFNMAVYKMILYGKVDKDIAIWQELFTPDSNQDDEAKRLNIKNDEVKTF